jgi:hypothetical protein
MRTTIMLSLLILTVALAPGCGDKQEEATPGDKGTPEITDNQPPAEPDGPTIPGAADAAAMMGKAALTASCTSCHEIETVTDAEKSKEDWAAQVKGCMSENPLSDAEAEQLPNYRAAHPGVV